MNKLISISGKINSTPRTKSGGGARLDTNGFVSCERINILKENLSATINDWKSLDSFSNPIVSIKYIRVVPKSLRMSALLKQEGVSIEKTIIGASFASDSDIEKHVIVYLVPLDILESAIHKLEQMHDLLLKVFNGIIDSKTFSIIAGTKNNPSEEDLKYKQDITTLIHASGINSKQFISLIQDIYYIEDIYIDKKTFSSNSSMFISFYDIGVSEDELLSKLHLPRSTTKIGSPNGGHSYYLAPTQIQSIIARYPYIISMGVNDVRDIKIPEIANTLDVEIDIPLPSTEPIIGVIDGAFDQAAYFSNWVEYCSDYNFFSSDKKHGTAVSSLIVDGVTLNPDLEDGCGRFRVKHYSIMDSLDKISQFDLYNRIESIVKANSKIKVWNISLGTEQEINTTSISPVAALLDDLQKENDVIFVVSGTNNNLNDNSQPFIGAPADSINSIVVNAVTKESTIPEYARRGPVLSFHLCPDLCAIGGNSTSPLTVCSGKTLSTAYGTSFASCWVARKLAYLIHYLNCTREEAKAILLDAAYGWTSCFDKKWAVQGCGILPHNINSIINTPKDEIKLILKGTCDKYKTYTYDLQLPLDAKGKFPYWAKATLCYFPKCSRKQGVDYTQTEIDLHFGRLQEKETVKSINNNLQGAVGKHNIPEETARKEFRKWDCVKHICEEIKQKSRPREVLFNNYYGVNYAPWGFYLLKKRRTSATEDNPNFALVLTFKSMDNKNRYHDFINILRHSGWFVRELDVVTFNTIYEESQVDLEFNE